MREANHSTPKRYPYEGNKSKLQIENYVKGCLNPSDPSHIPTSKSLVYGLVENAQFENSFFT